MKKNQQKALQQGNVTLTHFFLFVNFAGKSFPTVIFGRCGNTGMINSAVHSAHSSAVHCVVCTVHCTEHCGVIYSMSTSREGTTEDFLLLSLMSTTLKNGSVGRFFFLTERSDPITTSCICIAPVRGLNFPMLLFIRVVSAIFGTSFCIRLHHFV